MTRANDTDHDQTTNGRNTMQTTPNARSLTFACPIVRTESDPLAAEFDGWDDAIVALDQALQDQHRARVAIEEEQTAVERLEASHVLRIEGPNAEARRARLTLELADDDRYTGHLRALREARERLWDAERRVVLARERCRLIRAAIACYGGEFEA